MPSPIGHSTGFNYGVRFAVYHGLPLVLQDRWDAAVACDLIAARGAQLHARLHDLPAGPGGRGRAPGRCSMLGSMTRFGCGGFAGAARARAPGRRVRDRGAPAVRVDRGARRHLEPARRPGGQGHRHRRAGAERRRGRGPRRGGCVCCPGRGGGDPRAGPEHLRRLLPRPGAHGRHLRARRVGAIRATWPPWTRTAT